MFRQDYMRTPEATDKSPNTESHQRKETRTTLHRKGKGKPKGKGRKEPTKGKAQGKGQIAQCGTVAARREKGATETNIV